MTPSDPRPRRRSHLRHLVTTLRDVARAAGVSTASASRALSSPDVVSAGISDRVHAAARRLHYVPNAAGRSLASQRSRLVGAIVSDLSEPIVAHALTGFEDSLAAAGYALVVATTNGVDGRACDRAYAFIGRDVEALVLAGVATDGLAAVFAAHPLPCVWLEASRPGTTEPGGPTLVQNGISLAARYLLQQGHRQFGTITSTMASAAAARDAVAGSGGATVAEEQLGGTSVDAVREAARRLLTRTPRPTALLCDSDAVAATVIHECLALGIGVPAELSVTGFGDGELARRTTPALTSIRIPAAEIGRGAAEALLARLRGQTAVLIELPVKLVVRESTGAAAR